MYSIKADLDSEEKVVLTQSVSLDCFVGTSALNVSVIGIMETEADLPTDLPYFNFDCSSNISNSTNTCTSVG